MEDNKNFDKVIDDLDTVTRKFGLHMQQASVIEPGVTPEGDIHPSAPFGDKTVLNATFIIGDLAYSDEVQNPEAAAVDKQFRELMPDTTSTFVDIREQLKKNLEEGKGILGDD